jgi:hypothetical protein
MYVIFNVGWMKVNYLSSLHLFLHLITIVVFADLSDLSSVETVLLVLYYFFALLGITVICAMLGYWIDDR